MALWRDPLDELIGELERALPIEPNRTLGPTAAEYQANLFDIQVVVGKSARHSGSLILKTARSTPNRQRLCYFRQHPPHASS